MLGAMPGTLPAQNVGQVVRKRLADGTYMYEERASSNGDVYNEASSCLHEL